MQDYPVGLLIHIARSRIRQAVLSRVAPRQLAAQQFWFLVNLLERPGLSQAELGERMRMDAPTTSRLAAAMTRRRLVRSRPDPKDRRRTVLALTDAGERLARDLAGTAEEVRDAVVAGMSSEDVAALRRGLAKVIANMDRFEGRAERAAPRRTS